MSAPDVLAVLEQAHEILAAEAKHYRLQTSFADSVAEARAAVTELMEAATVICGTLHDDTDVSRILGTSSILPFRMLRAALARCGGQS